MQNAWVISTSTATPSQVSIDPWIPLWVSIVGVILGVVNLGIYWRRHQREKPRLHIALAHSSDKERTLVIRVSNPTAQLVPIRSGHINLKIGFKACTIQLQDVGVKLPKSLASTDGVVEVEIDAYQLDHAIADWIAHESLLNSAQHHPKIRQVVARGRISIKTPGKTFKSAQVFFQIHEGDPVLPKVRSGLWLRSHLRSRRGLGRQLR